MMFPHLIGKHILLFSALFQRCPSCSHEFYVLLFHICLANLVSPHVFPYFFTFSTIYFCSIGFHMFFQVFFIMFSRFCPLSTRFSSIFPGVHPSNQGRHQGRAPLLRQMRQQQQLQVQRDQQNLRLQKTVLVRGSRVKAIVSLYYGIIIMVYFKTPPVLLRGSLVTPVNEKKHCSWLHYNNYLWSPNHGESILWWIIPWLSRHEPLGH